MISKFTVGSSGSCRGLGSALCFGDCVFYDKASVIQLLVIQRLMTEYSMIG